MPDSVRKPRRMTKPARIAADLAEKLQAICWHERVIGTDILDPVIRPVIEERFAALPQDIRESALARVAGGADARTTP